LPSAFFGDDDNHHNDEDDDDDDNDDDESEDLIGEHQWVHSQRTKRQTTWQGAGEIDDIFPDVGKMSAFPVIAFPYFPRLQNESHCICLASCVVLCKNFTCTMSTTPCVVQ